MAHTPLPPSIPPAVPPPSRCRAPDTHLLVPPALSPSHVASAPTGSLAHSAPYNSPTLRHTLPPPLPDSSLPAPRTTHVRTSPSDTPPPSRSIHTESAAALLRSVSRPARSAHPHPSPSARIPESAAPQSPPLGCARTDRSCRQSRHLSPLASHPPRASRLIQTIDRHQLSTPLWALLSH